MAIVHVAETFVSLQGESSYAGLTCFFIRLAGCNLQCTYCDTSAAREQGRSMDVDVLVTMACRSHASIIEITGGEPLLQEGTILLAERLCAEARRPILVETNGSQSVAKLPADAIAIVDVKCPGSGMADRFDRENLVRLRPHDELKFVLSDRADYDWARRFLEKAGIFGDSRKVYFSPVYGVLNPGELGGWIVADGLSVRLQVQLHKVIGMR